jgi:hypothetical protein
VSSFSREAPHSEDANGEILPATRQPLPPAWTSTDRLTAGQVASRLKRAPTRSKLNDALAARLAMADVKAQKIGA